MHTVDTNKIDWNGIIIIVITHKNDHKWDDNFLSYIIFLLITFKLLNITFLF